jgi:hypothetical protein
MPTATGPVVYLSYRWIDAFDAGQDRWGRVPDPHARELADKLRAAGHDVRLDIYFRDSLHGFRPPERIAGDPQDPWLSWSARQIAEAEAVLLFCTPEYADADPDRGASSGECWNWSQLDEATRIGTPVPALWWDWYAIAKECAERPQKFIPIGVGHYHGDQIPAFVRGAGYINLTDDGVSRRLIAASVRSGAIACRDKASSSATRITTTSSGSTRCSAIYPGCNETMASRFGLTAKSQPARNGTRRSRERSTAPR